MEQFFDVLLESWQNRKLSPPRTHTCIVIDFDAYKRKLAKQLCTFMKNVWLPDPALEAFDNIATCRNKASQMRERILLAILCAQEYMRSRGRCLATDSHKYAKETMNNCNSNEVHPPP